MSDARRVADLLGIPFYVIDVQDFFRREIVQFFIDEHARGRTPNPCIQCNRQVRFTYLYERALALDAGLSGYRPLRPRGAKQQLVTSSTAASTRTRTNPTSSTF